jgi:putative membrane protein
MLKTTFLGAAALVILGIHGTQAQTAIPPSPKNFVAAALQSDRYEIMAASIAEVQTRDPHVLTFAREMIQEHARLAEELRQTAIASDLLPLEPGISSDQARLLSSLQSVRGQDFDKAYARQQELAHAEAVAVDESFAAAGADQNLRKAAQSALPTIRDHLKKAEQLSLEVGGP